MKQLVQNMRNGKTEIREIPVTAPPKGMALIRNACSVVSAGTERLVADFAEKNLVEKAASRPDLLKQVVEKARREGIVSSLDAALNRLDRPMYPGYSAAGTIVEVGDAMTGFSVGDRVACGGGNYAVHAEYCTVPKNLIVKIPDNVSFEEASFATLGAVAVHGFRLSAPQLNESVLVIGLGLLGLMTVQIAKAAGCRVIGMDLRSDRLEVAKTLGIETASREELLCKIPAFTRGYGADHVLICAGSQDNDTIELAANACRNRGSIVAIGAVGLDLPRRPFYDKEIRFIVSRSYGPGRYDHTYEEEGMDYPIGYVRWTENRNMESFLDLISSGKISLAPLITHSFPIEQADQAYKLIKGELDQQYLGVVITYPQAEPSEPIHQAIRLRPPSLPQPIVVGMIGAGNYASATFLPLLKSRPQDVALKSIASNRGASAREAAEKYGFEFAEVNSDAILDDPAINTVAILTRHNLHSDLVARALENGKHVYCEKPIALSLEQLQKVYTIYHDHLDQVLMVGFNRRFAPLIIQMMELLAGAKEPAAISYTVNAGFIPASHWVQDPDQGGGRILGEACHMIDLVSFIAKSRAIQVSTVGLPNMGVYSDDNVNIQLKFENGSIASINYLANGEKSYPKEILKVFCAGRTLVLNDFRTLEQWFNGSKTSHRSAIKADKGHQLSWDSFLNAVRKGESLPIPAEEMFQSSLATIAALESLTSNEPVSIPDNSALLQ